MIEYLPVLEALKLPIQAARILTGEIALPKLVNAEQPPLAFGYPPALIPLWLAEGPEYGGLWCHWFTPARKPTYVTSSLENGYSVDECARNLTQLAILLVELREYVDETAETFLAHFGLSIEDFPDDELFVPQNHPAFADGPPADWHSETNPGYLGDFPRKDMPLTEETIRATCGYELLLLSEVREKILAGPHAPAWLTAVRPDHAFGALLDSGDLQGAWMALNTPSWSIEATRGALDRLASTAGDPTFRVLADAWIAQDHQPNVYGGSIDPRHVMDRE